MNQSFGNPAIVDGDLGPPPLSRCAAKTIAQWMLRNLGRLSTADPVLEFPTSSEANQLIFNALQDENPISDECLLLMVKLFGQAPISNLYLRRSTVTTNTLRRCLLDHCWAKTISRLDLSGTTEIACGVFDVFANAMEPIFPHLEVLHLGSRPELLSSFLTSGQHLLQGLSLMSTPEKEDRLGLGTLNPNLKALTVHGSQQGLTQLELPMRQLLGTTSNLLYLDISFWNIESVQFLQVLKNLNTLVLHDVPKLCKDDVDQICNLDTLKKLDLSQSRRGNAEYPSPFVILDQIIISLTALEFLDISGTNLADNPVPESSGKWPEVLPGRVQSDIVGLRNLRRPLKYLGLLFCDNACFNERIPAERVAGSADWGQILTALSVHRDRVDMICNILSETRHFFTAYEHKGDGEHKLKCLGHFATIMNNFLDEKMIQIGCSTATSLLLRSLNRVDSVQEAPAGLRHKLASVLTRSLERHLTEPEVCYSLCRCLCSLRLPNDVAPDMFIRLVTALLSATNLHGQNENLLYRTCVVLKSLVTFTSIEQKRQVVTAGVIRMCLETVSVRLGSPNHLSMGELWSILVSLTDDSPDNCEHFVSYGGLDAFYKTFGIFNRSDDIVWYLAVVMANIAEVPHLADMLLRQDYVQIFIQMLDLNLGADDLGTSYVAAGILSNLMARVCLTADPESSWNLVCSECPYQDTVTKIFDTINLWDLAAEQQVFYVSFRPFILLLANDSCRIGQVYAAFALAHGTSKAGNFRESYRDLVKREGALPHLHRFVDHFQNADCPLLMKLRQLAQIVLEMSRSINMQYFS